MIEGAKQAWLADESRSSAVVQLSMKSGLAGCKVFLKKSPASIITCLVDLGNSMNTENSATTFL